MTHTVNGRVFRGLTRRELGDLGYVMRNGPEPRRYSGEKPPRYDESKALGWRIMHILSQDKNRSGVRYNVCASCGSVTRDESEALGEIGPSMFKEWGGEMPSCPECEGDAP